MKQKINSFTDVHRLVAHLSDASKRHHYSLEHMFELLEFLGNPQNRLKVIHVAGTSGKTSTAYYAAALLEATGHRVGLTVSPHVDEVNERVQIGLKPMAEAEFCKRFGEFLNLINDCRIAPSYFELFITFALWEFAAREVDYAVIEVGIGGLLDSTNVFDDPKKVCVITDIGYDHMRLLGDTLPEIAAQKAGIIMLHNAIFCNQQSGEIIEVIQKTASQKQADLHIVTSPNIGPELDFLPLFQQRNFGLSLAAAQFVISRDGLPQLDKTAIQNAARTYVPARMEVRVVNGKTVIMDIAHNGQKLHALLESVYDKYPGKAVAALIRMPAGENSLPKLKNGIGEVAKGVNHIIITSLSETGDRSDSSFRPTQIAAICREAGYDSYDIVPDPKQAFAALCVRQEPVLLVTGSTYLLNHIRPLFATRITQATL